MTEYDEAVAEAIELGLMTSVGEATERAQCPTCGEVFSTDANFERHLSKGRNREDYDGPWCQPPASVGLIQHKRGWWQLPGPDPDRSIIRRSDGGSPVERS
jgi:hypothetical protein